MAPKGGNAKKEGGRAKKAENEAKKEVAATKAKEAKEAEEWKDGAKGLSKADLAANKAAEQAKKKAEREAMLAAEEASGPSKVKSAPKAGSKKKAPITGLDAGPRAPPGQGIANFSVNDPLNLRSGRDEDVPIEELSATGIDAMMEALEIANQKTDKQAMGAKAGDIERHPERRFKAAFEAYKEAQMPIIKDEYPGLRKNQYEQKLFDKFQKSPENPFNQTQVAYNATKEEKLEKLKETIAAREAKYKA